METRGEQYLNERNYNKLISDIFDNNIKCEGGLLVPNPFSMNIGFDKKHKVGYDYYALYEEIYVKRNFSTIGQELWTTLARHGKTIMYDIIGFIAINIKYNTNIIRIKQDSIRDYTGRNINGRDFISAISELENRGVIKRTDMRSIYTINPIYIYKGSLNKLAVLMLDDNFGTPNIVDSKLNIDKVALFQEKEDIKPVIIYNEKYNIRSSKNGDNNKIIGFDFTKRVK